MICAAGGRVLGGGGWVGGVGEGHSVKYIAIIIKNLTHENKSKEIRSNHSQINKKGITQYPVN